MLNRYPYNNGHLMIAPRRHIAQLEKLTPTELRQMMALLTKCLRILRLSLRPDGFNVGMNLGRVAGAGVEHHLHLHIVPRWNGDTNFMPVLGQTRVVSEHLQVTAARLRMAFRGPGTRQIRVMPRRAVRTRQRK
jgi:ATP adenylyltransferase